MLSDLSGRIESLRLEGKTTEEIMVVLGCARSTVIYWTRKLGLGYPSRPRRSNDFDRDTLASAAAKSRSWFDLCKELGRKRSAALHIALQEQVSQYGIDVSHFIYPDPRKSPAGRKRPGGMTLQEMLESKTVRSHALRLRLIAEGVKDEVCEGCGNSEWLGMPLSLELDHINGDKTDNRIENLRILCPNCHSTLSPYHRVPFRYRKTA